MDALLVRKLESFKAAAIDCKSRSPWILLTQKKRKRESLSFRASNITENQCVQPKPSS